MKAIVCEKFGHPSTLVYKDVESRQPKEKEVLVEIKACGVNFPDTLIVQGLYQFKPELPFTPGSDIAGVVKAVGEKIKHLKVGDEVFGFVAHGGFAEEVVLDGKAVFPKPPNMDFPIAASFLMAYGTSYHALKDRARLKEGETLLVLGASGGVGLAAVELGKLMGAKVIAAASTDEKLELCKEYGADETINYSTEDLKAQIKVLTEGKGVDVIIDFLAAPYFQKNINSLNFDGRMVMLALMGGWKVEELILANILRKRLHIMGSTLRARTIEYKIGLINDFSDYALKRFTKGELQPVIDSIFDWSDVADAHRLMESNKNSGKIILKVG